MTAPEPTIADSPNATDFYDVRHLLSEDEQAVQDAVGRFVDERVLPIIAEAFDQHQFPADLIPEIAEMGLLGCNIEGYDC
ncbi:MAG: acyl-CoA dehydrogenase family protein, partial [Planctomycetes bacterium]|nr:acyl-CoA dehydrogenase family protein [Planctomycetota bacterium]